MRARSTAPRSAVPCSRVRRERVRRPLGRFDALASSAPRAGAVRARRAWALALASLGVAACGGGTDMQPEMPDPSVVDRSADDLGLPEASGPAASAGDALADTPPRPPQVIESQRMPIEGDPPTLRIVAPREGQLIRGGAASLRLRLRDWELEPDGQHVHVIVDDEPYIAVRDVSEPIDLNALVQEHLGHELSEGTHVLRVFPSRGHHESVKTDGAFAMRVFHYRSRTDGFELDADAPLLTYSRPKGCNPLGDRVLLDFYTSNVELAADGPRVHWSIDGGVEGDIVTWTPHWIEDLGPGEHTIRLTLQDAEGHPLPGPFNDTTRTIRVADSCD